MTDEEFKQRSREDEAFMNRLHAMTDDEKRRLIEYLQGMLPPPAPERA
ncbi:hypothetical protein [Sphingomonas oryzagri]|uniref:Uncharacterized protein n=1 Tax=Sphingomonas oryzagri TaxID=3042314 RepID=A0ABT6N1A3_9SPHN|nr:hypothetical protein [Sphingomonas oryzagri]MDH7638967.1 hypothetical protein [Sphingomonas oryzagri]